METPSSQALGEPLPFDDHAVSVSLPLWSHVVGYEEGDPSVVNAMKIGYPRFKLHASVALLNQVLIQRRALAGGFGGSEVDVSKWSCFAFPTQRVALRFQAFLIKAIHLVLKATEAAKECSMEGSVQVEAVGFRDVFAVYFPAIYFPQGKPFWQHTGEVLSSRLAEDALHHLSVALPAITTSVFDSSPTAANSVCNGSTESNKKQRLVRSCASDAHITECRLDHVHHNCGVSDASDPAQSVDTPVATAHSDDLQGIRAEQTIRDRIASLLMLPEYTDQPPSHAGVTLTLCGMASISSALRLVQAHFEQNLKQAPDKGEIVVFGFPYLDTLKLVQRTELAPGGYHFFGHGDDSDLDKLEALLLKQQQQQQQQSSSESSKVAKDSVVVSKNVWAVFTEFPSNPRLRCPNLARLSALARTHGFLIMVDDTIGSFCNIDLIHPPDLQVDILCTSLTKIYSGTGDAFAGSLVINPHSPHASQLRALVPGLLLPGLYYSDAITLERNSRDYPQRAHLINNTTAQLVQWLHAHPCTESVYYPSLDPDSSRIFNTFLRTEDKLCDELKAIQFVAGYGCLFSIVLRDQFNTQAFFDALDVCKGPSLGTNFTLSCPYTLLAHYTELPWAAQYGVSSRLVRVSVGLEEFQVLQKAFIKAFSAAGYTES